MKIKNIIFILLFFVICSNANAVRIRLIFDENGHLAAVARKADTASPWTVPELVAIARPYALPGTLSQFHLFPPLSEDRDLTPAEIAQARQLRQNGRYPTYDGVTTRTELITVWEAYRIARHPQFYTTP